MLIVVQIAEAYSESCQTSKVIFGRKSLMITKANSKAYHTSELQLFAKIIKN